MSDMTAPFARIELNGLDSLKAENLPPCARCGHKIQAGQWITPDGTHHHCTEDHA